jgi:hypothetical protein
MAPVSECWRHLTCPGQVASWRFMLFGMGGGEAGPPRNTCLLMVNGCVVGVPTMKSAASSIRFPIVTTSPRVFSNRRTHPVQHDVSRIPGYITFTLRSPAPPKTQQPSPPNPPQPPQDPHQDYDAPPPPHPHSHHLPLLLPRE